MRWPVTRATVVAGADRLARIAQGADDLKQAGTITELVLREAPPGTDDSVAVELAGALD
jgi:hypothetical protein